jgi:hypothetical protein
MSGMANRCTHYSVGPELWVAMKKPQPHGTTGAKLLTIQQGQRSGVLTSDIQAECSAGVNGRAPGRRAWLLLRCRHFAQRARNVRQRFGEIELANL